MSKAVPLAFELFQKDTAKAPILLLPGLFGSKQNWRSIAKQLSQKLNSSIYTIDLRNHGDSPHASSNSYECMKNDIILFAKTHKIDSAHVVGHSMGGKLLCHMVLSKTPWIRKSVVVDIAPIALPNNYLNPPSLFERYIEQMHIIQAQNVKSIKEADELLSKTIKKLPIRQFLLTNLKFFDDGTYKFRINLDTLQNDLKEIWGFPNHKTSANNEILFLKGGNSTYISENGSKIIRRLFPNSRLVTIDGAGHWVHAEKPYEFISVVSEFLDH